MSDLTVDDVFMKAGYIPRWLEAGRVEGRVEVAQNLLNKGWSVEDTAETAELDIEIVKSLQNKST